MRSTTSFASGIPAYLITLLLALTAAAQSTETQPAETPPADEQQQAADARLAVMRQAATAIRLKSESATGGSKPLPLQAEPVLRFNDPARTYQDGTLWLFGKQGRPATAMEIWSHDARQAEWFYSIVSLSAERLSGSWDGQARWVPQVAGAKFLPIPAASPPAEQQAVRRRQLKLLAREFSAYEVFRGDRSELRLLAKPLQLYTDPSQRVLDGGLFLFTHGTNPELLLLIEAIEGEEQAQWRYAFAPSGSAEFHGLHEDQEVWTLPEAAGVTGAATDAYWLFPRTVVAEDEVSPSNPER